MINELLFLITAILIFCFVFCCFLLGRRWLYAAIAVNLIAISVFGAEVVSIFGKVTNVGNIFYAAVFFAGQLLVEHYGKKEGKRSIWLGFSFVLFFILVAYITIRYTPIESSTNVAQAIKNLFVFTPRIAAASLLAYLLSQSLNINLYSYLVKIKEKQIWKRIILSNFLGQIVDSVIFFSIAFWGVLSNATIINTIITGFATKFFVGILAIPLVYISYKFKTKEEILDQEAEAIILSIGDGLVMTNKKGKIILVNSAFSEMLGWKSEEVVGKIMTDVIRRKDEKGNLIPLEERIINQALSGKKVTTSITNHSYFIRKDGTEFPVIITVTPVFIDSKIVGAVEVFRDVTKEKEVERLRNDFLSLASHQLRTPLSGTKWLIETLSKEDIGKLNKKQKEYVNNLYKINTRMIQLISDMLNVLHIQSGTIKIKKEYFTLAKLYEEIELNIKDAAKNRGIAIETNFDAQSKIQIYTDFQSLKNIIESFVSNAINYSEEKSKISIGCKDTNNEIVFWVKDNGIGIPQDEQKRIFERFYRASNAQKINTTGTGLGLYIAYMLSKSIGAKVRLESTENKGSTFYLEIPK